VPNDHLGEGWGECVASFRESTLRFVPLRITRRLILFTKLLDEVQGRLLERVQPLSCGCALNAASLVLISSPLFFNQRSKSLQCLAEEGMDKRVLSI
jgi:hypothetical protein